MTEEEIAAIAAKHRMTKFPNLALTRERLSRKAKAEPKFRFEARADGLYVVPVGTLMIMR